MSAIGPGDFVICVDARQNGFNIKPSLTEGAMYQVEKLIPWSKGCLKDNCNLPRVAIIGVWGFGCPNRFRPLIDPDAQLADEEKELEDA